MNDEDSRLYGKVTDEENGVVGNYFPRQEPVAIIGMACRFPGPVSALGDGLSSF